MLLNRGTGLGESPGYYCYDSNRPAWLPYSLDSPTESACKWNPVTIAGNIKACAAGSPSCGVPSLAQQDPTLSGPGVAPAGEPSNVPNCSFGQTFNPATNACEIDVSAIPTWLYFAAGALVLLPVLLRGGR